MLLDNQEEAITELQTIQDLLRWATSQFYRAELFYGHGTDNAWDEAVALTLHALHLPVDVTPHVLTARLTTRERREVVELLTKRLEQRIPTAYLTHEAWFAGLKFYVDERVLIPRSPFAELIEQQFENWLQPQDVSRILEIGTGSGCMAIACAKAFPEEVVIDAVDISAAALEVAAINVQRHDCADQVRLIQSDLFANLDAKQPYDLIISNPPYVDAKDIANLPAEYRHEPALALAAGEDGLDIVKRILSQAANYLTPEGILVVEVGNSEEALTESYPHVPFIWQEFERGGGGVFILTTQQLRQYANYFKEIPS